MPHARVADPQTSHDAANSVGRITETQEVILVILRHGGLTDTEIVELYHKASVDSPALVPRASDSGIRSRRAELTARGFIKDSGRRAKLASGRQAIVWERVSGVKATWHR